MWGILQEKVYKILITDLNELKQRQNGMGQHVVIAAAINLSVASSIAPDQ